MNVMFDVLHDLQLSKAAAKYHVEVGNLVVLNLFT